MAEVRDSKGLVHILLDEENGYSPAIDLAYDIEVLLDQARRQAK